MTTNRLVERLAENAARGRSGLLPFLTAGFPDLDTTAALIRRADALGVTAVELGIPYSDSVADGLVIQSSFHAALARGFRLSAMFDRVAAIRATVRCGLIAMASFSIVHRAGTTSFVERAAASGFDGVILPDVPIEEAEGTFQAATRVGLCYIGLIAPATSPDRAKAIARRSTGFVYQIATAGTTGERSTLSDGLSDRVAALRRRTSLPVCVGFGISRPEHVRAVCAVADGAIVGSALVRQIAEGVEAGRNNTDIVESVGETIGAMMAVV